MRAVIVTSMRNEGPFILEWLAHHMAIGFNDFLIFSNDCEDGTDAMLDRLDEMGLITHLNNPRKGDKTVQWRALQRASRHRLVKKSDWIYFTDVDEFLNIKSGDGMLSDLLSARPDATGFALSWRMFGAGVSRRFMDIKITEQFQRAAPVAMIWPWRAVQFKSLFKNDGTYARLGVHRPRDPDPAKEAAARWYDDNGNPMPGNVPKGPTLHKHMNPRYQLAQINHYALGSAENFLVKCARGRANRSNDDIDLTYWLDRNFTADPDTSIQRIWPLSDPILEELKSDLQLSRLHAQSVKWRERKIAELLQDTDYLYLLARIRQMGVSQALPGQLQWALFHQLIQLRKRKHAALMAEKAGNTDRG